MSKLGDFLKECRKKHGFSLKDIYEQTNITDSKLSKIERGHANYCPNDLKKLAKLFNIKLIQLYVFAGYLSEDDIKEYQFVFQGVSTLDNEEMQHIQSQIDFLNKRKKVD